MSCLLKEIQFDERTKYIEVHCGFANYKSFKSFNVLISCLLSINIISLYFYKVFSEIRQIRKIRVFYFVASTICFFS